MKFTIEFGAHDLRAVENAYEIFTAFDGNCGTLRRALAPLSGLQPLAKLETHLTRLIFDHASDVLKGSKVLRMAKRAGVRQPELLEFLPVGDKASEHFE